MYSRTPYSALIEVREMKEVLLNNWEKKAEDVMKRNILKNRNDIAGQPIEIEWHVFPGATSMQIAGTQRIYVGDRVGT